MGPYWLSKLSFRDGAVFSLGALLLLWVASLLLLIPANSLFESNPNQTTFTVLSVVGAIVYVAAAPLLAFLIDLNLEQHDCRSPGFWPTLAATYLAMFAGLVVTLFLYGNGVLQGLGPRWPIFMPMAFFGLAPLAYLLMKPITHERVAQAVAGAGFVASLLAAGYAVATTQTVQFFFFSLWLELWS